MKEDCCPLEFVATQSDVSWRFKKDYRSCSSLSKAEATGSIRRCRMREIRMVVDVIDGLVLAPSAQSVSGDFKQAGLGAIRETKCCHKLRPRLGRLSFSRTRAKTPSSPTRWRRLRRSLYAARKASSDDLILRSSAPSAAAHVANRMRPLLQIARVRWSN